MLCGAIPEAVQLFPARDRASGLQRGAIVNGLDHERTPFLRPFGIAGIRRGDRLQHRVGCRQISCGSMSPPHGCAAGRGSDGRLNVGDRSPMAHHHGGDDFFHRLPVDFVFYDDARAIAAPYRRALLAGPVLPLLLKRGGLGLVLLAHELHLQDGFFAMSFVSAGVEPVRFT